MSHGCSIVFIYREWFSHGIFQIPFQFFQYIFKPTSGLFSRVTRRTVFHKYGDNKEGACEVWPHCLNLCFPHRHHICSIIAPNCSQSHYRLLAAISSRQSIDHGVTWHILFCCQRKINTVPKWFLSLHRHTGPIFSPIDIGWSKKWLHFCCSAIVATFAKIHDYSVFS